MMKINSKYLKSNKVFRFLLIFSLFSIVLTIGLIPFVQWSEMNVLVDCKKIKNTEEYCLFNCTVKSDEDSIGRIIVTHSVWAAIFDEEFNITKNQTKFIEIQLPRRDYTYYLRGGFYNEEKYGTLEGVLYC